MKSWAVVLMLSLPAGVDAPIALEPTQIIIVWGIATETDCRRWALPDFRERAVKLGLKVEKEDCEYREQPR
ncbi:MAG: hypothetical protein AABZ67_00470 [Pseudomonadota bacterium]